MDARDLELLLWEAIKYVERGRVWRTVYTVGFTLFEFARGGLKWPQVKRILSGKTGLIISSRWDGSDKRGIEKWWLVDKKGD